MKVKLVAILLICGMMICNVTPAYALGSKVIDPTTGKDMLEQIGTWVKNSDGSWSYTTSKRQGFQIKNGVTSVINLPYSDSVLLIDNSLYAFDTKGKMVTTGWYQCFDGVWVYASSDGKLARNKTIDGYAINNDGYWFVDKNEYNQSNFGNAPGFYVEDNKLIYSANGIQVYIVNNKLSVWEYDLTDGRWRNGYIERPYIVRDEAQMVKDYCRVSPFNKKFDDSFNYYVEFYHAYSSDVCEDHEQTVHVYKEYRNGTNELLFENTL